MASIERVIVTVYLPRSRRERAAKGRPEKIPQQEWDSQNWKLGFVKLEGYLDECEGTRWLANPAHAKLVADSLRFFAGERYDLISYVILPSHFQWLFRPLPEWVATLPTTPRVRSPRERIMNSARRFSALRCNRLLNRTGEYWQHESYDHWVRDLDEWERIIHYIENNPVKAGLVQDPSDWVFSSAYVRKQPGLEFGSPIPKS
ncbi:MAG: hypothetical protein EXS09_18275 [Gemmataceae bacterium]|nr:hypothetical protein [Gemmataceae bacterium]